jgi:hypothetical protein
LEEKNWKNHIMWFAVTSVTIGIIEICYFLFLFFCNGPIEYSRARFTPIMPLVLEFMAVLVGIVLGIIGLKSKLKGIAIAGIVICSIIAIWLFWILNFGGPFSY